MPPVTSGMVNSILCHGHTQQVLQKLYCHSSFISELQSMPQTTYISSSWNHLSGLWSHKQFKNWSAHIAQKHIQFDNTSLTSMVVMMHGSFLAIQIWAAGNHSSCVLFPDLFESCSDVYSRAVILCLLPRGLEVIVILKALYGLLNLEWGSFLKLQFYRLLNPRPAWCTKH